MKRMKRMICAELGIKSFDIDLPEQVSESDLIKQLPLPKHINEEKVLSEISLDEVRGQHALLYLVHTFVHTIATNAGVEGTVVIRSSSITTSPVNFFFSLSGEYVNMVKAGIIDSLKVIKTALVDSLTQPGERC
ncbi:chaperonin CPN60-2, mitochondrial-like [Arachis stenosperma]|uniref:chaperonin CPN60-2, mitochondrial-like n=1 Tax=Arachis stenosperma TaxID=217475 RepID=UPI0025AD6B4C|nr:chaperonin CPN60-2, mitochondrial-like [Arachis stenosperma]